MKIIDKIGVILVIVGFAISFLFWAGFLYGFCCYFIGNLILLFSGNLKLKKILILIVLPLILFIPYASAMNHIISYYDDSLKVDLIVPANFRGSAIIIPNKNFGQKYELKNRREQIIFDQHGIHFYPNDFESGFSKFKVFFQNSDGSLKQISTDTEGVSIVAYGQDSIERIGNSNERSIPYYFVKVGVEYSDQNYPNTRCKLIDLIKVGEFEKAYNILND